MIFLICSIIFTSFLAISFKICERLKIDTFQSIIFNYLTCILTGFVINGSVTPFEKVITTEWFPWAIIMGLFFICLFNLTALTVKRNGVAVTSVATKLSLVIPFVFSVFLYNEKAGLIKIAGILIALIAVILTCLPSKNEAGRTYKNLLLPGIVFFGCGILDTIIKYTEQRFVTADNQEEFLTTCFTVAFLTGSLFYLIWLVTKKVIFQPKAVLAGICIGIPNYLSIWCLINVFKIFPSGSSVIIPVNNMGIVLLSAVVAGIFFRERLSAVNRIGIALALLSIFLISADI